jgi:hypothetical protein
MSRLDLLCDDKAENSIMQTITIAVSAILIAAGLVTAPGLINNARDNNAREDLANIATAQGYQLSENGKYATDVVELDASKIKLTLSADSKPRIFASAKSYSSFAKSSSGAVFWRSSETADTYRVASPWPAVSPVQYPSDLPWPASADEATAQHAKNMLTNSGFEQGVGKMNTGEFGHSSLGHNTSWGVGDSSSAKIVGDGSDRDTYLYYIGAGQSEGVTLGMEGGKTYTVSGTIHLEGQQDPSEEWNRARGITVFYLSDATGPNYVEVRSTQAPNAAGDYRLSTTFTLPNDTTEVFIRWYDGSRGTNGNASWDNLMLNEGGTALYSKGPAA